VQSQRVLILSAPVGAGHDVAAARAAQELRAAGHSVEVSDGLALLGRRLERVVVGGYHFQLCNAAWTWRLLYAAFRNQRSVRIVGAVLARSGHGQLEQSIRDSRPDVIVSAYPLVSAALAGLRRRGRLQTPCATLITDFDPHPGWIHPDLDRNLTVAEEAHQATAVRPPVGDSLDATGWGVRDELCIDPAARMVLIVGGAWGIGNLAGAARALSRIDGVEPVVVCGRNSELRDRLLRDPSFTTSRVLGYRDDLIRLIAASDLLVQHAGGMTCLEAFGLGVPIVMFDPIPGHGDANTNAMAKAGLVVRADTDAELAELVRDPAWWCDAAPANAARGRRLFDHPAVTDHVAEMVGAQPHRRRGLRRRAPASLIALASALLILSDGVRDFAVHAADYLRP
jgi:UDP-N-acetylglucosamine:LPS N-acetylglucosamine transferase